MTGDRTAYVYSIEVDGVVRYYGKGSGKLLKRAGEHRRNAMKWLRRRHTASPVVVAFVDYKLAKSIQSNSQVHERIVASDLTHEEAFQLERDLIIASAAHQLWNVAEGGKGAGFVSPQTRVRMSEAAKRRALRPESKEHYLRGWANRSEESRRRFIDASQAARLTPGYKERMATKAKQQWKDPALAERMRVGLEKGRRAPRPGNPAFRQKQLQHRKQVPGE